MAIRDDIITAIAGTLDTIDDVSQEIAGAHVASRLESRIAGLEVTYPDHLTDVTEAGQYRTAAQNQLGSAIAELFETTTWRTAFMGAIADGILVATGAVTVGSGTVGKVPKWATTTTLTDSIITESSGLISVGGALTTTGANTLSNLAGTGTRVVVASSTGLLSASSTLISGSGTSGQATYWNGTNSLTGSNNFTFTDGGSGGATNLLLKNSNNTSNSDSILIVSTAGSSARNAAIVFSTGSAGYGMGYDSNRYLSIRSTGSAGASFSSGTNYFTADTSLNLIGLFTSTPSYEVDVQKSKFGQLVFAVRNTGLSAMSYVESAGGTDAQFGVYDGTHPWVHGVDASDSGAYVFSTGSTLGTATMLKITTAGNVTIPALAGTATRAVVASSTGLLSAASALVTGSGVAGQVAYWSSTNVLAGDSGFTYNSTTDVVTIGSLSPGSGFKAVISNGSGDLSAPGPAIMGGGSSGFFNLIPVWSSSLVNYVDGFTTFSFLNGASGGATKLLVKNINNTASSDSSVIVSTAGSTARNSMLVLSNSSTGGYAWGYDSNRYISFRACGLDGSQFTAGSGYGSNFITIDASLLRVGVFTSAPTYDFDVVLNTGNTNLTVGVRNTGFGSILRVESGGGEDARIIVNGWVQGPDVSTSNTYKFDTGITLGGSTKFQITTAGAVSVLAGNLDVTRSQASGVVSLLASNTSSTGSANAAVIARTTGSSGGDPVFVLDAGASGAYGMGYDVSASKFYMGFGYGTDGSSFPGTFSWFTSTGSRIGFGLNRNPDASYAVDIGTSGAGTTSVGIGNGSGPFDLHIYTGGGASDAAVIMQSGGTGGTLWTFGPDASDSNTFKWDSGTSSIGGATKFQITTAGIATISNLAGTGTRYVTASSAGLLSTTASVAGGSGTAGQVAYWSSSTALTSDSAFTYSAGALSVTQMTATGTAFVGSTAVLFTDVSAGLGFAYDGSTSNNVAAFTFNPSITKNDSNTRQFFGMKLKPTLNTGGSNTTTTFNVFEVDTANTAMNGLITNLSKWSYGGNVRLLLESDGRLNFLSGGYPSIWGLGDPISTNKEVANFTMDTSNGLTIQTAKAGAGSYRPISLRAGTGAVLYLETSLNIGMNGTSYGGGSGVLFIGDAATAPTSDPSGGVIIFSDSGAAKVRGASGTVTTFGPADPHCPECGADFMHEFESDRYGYLAVCLKCAADEIGDRKWILREKRATAHAH